MAEDVSEILKEIEGLGPPRFDGEPWYNGPGDCIIWHCRDDEYYGERIDDKLTVFRSMADQAIVGCQIKGVLALAEKLGPYQLEVQCREFSLGLLVMAAQFEAMPMAPDPLERKRTYEVLREKAGTRNVTLEPVTA